jgi:hypothetical protein
VLQVCVVDSAGNYSPTSAVSFVHVPVATLALLINGGGKVSPNPNGAVLVVGQAYSVTATAAAGFAFNGWTVSTNWNGAVPYGGTVLSFVMQSNLTLQANFRDITKPRLAITAPLVKQRWSNSVFTVTGLAGDNVAVSNVWYQLNGGGWNPANTTNNWTNWTTDVSLVPGTNVVQACAVDTTGNTSLVSTVVMQYVVPVPAAVGIQGLGWVTPDYDGQMLEIGRAYSMTAHASRGFAFAGWTGAVTTGKATVGFLMESNLTLMANFVDVQKPVVAVHAPRPGQLWSNAVFTVTGMAGDNVAVSNVWFIDNGGAWIPTTTTNNWTNWQGDLSLSAGPNAIRAFAEDMAGNFSPAVTVTLTYVVSDTLRVRSSGLGTFTPNYNNAMLQIGKAYTMTARPVPGFAVKSWTLSTNWAGGVDVDKAVLTFVMQSNLTLQANFVDATRPTLVIAAPGSGQRWSNSVFTVTGTAGDNVQVSNVWYQVNGSGWNLAGSSNGWGNWWANAALTPGTNVVQVYSVDTSGNLSPTGTVAMQFVVPVPATVQTNGRGTVSPNYNGAMLEVGRAYSMTATPAAGFAFSNWTGTVTSLAATVNFLMATNLALTANFVDITKPVVGITAPTANQRLGRAVLHVTGTAGDNVGVTGVFYLLNGGAWSAAGTTNGYTNWTATVALPAGANVIKAYAEDAAGNDSAISSASFYSSNAFVMNFVSLSNQVLTLNVSTGLNCVIDISTNLQDWSAWTNFTSTNSTMRFMDPATDGQRFYRGVVP